MQIPPTPISAAAAALPGQAIRETRSGTPSGTAVSPNANQTVEKLEPGQKSEDRDANEQYSQAASKKPKADSSNEQDLEDSKKDGLWNLAVEDDQPPPGLDLRG